MRVLLDVLKVIGVLCGVLIGGLASSVVWGGIGVAFYCVALILIAIFIRLGRLAARK